MTKLVQVRVIVATDDDIELRDVKSRLQGMITAGGTENIAENGEIKRIHWGTADVLQGPERVPGRARGPRATTTATKGELPV